MKYVGAYLSRGGEAALEALLDMLEKEHVIVRGSPDLFARAYRKFGVDEAEELRGRARSKPLQNDSRVFAFFVPTMTTEAQNSLLKTLEEPAADALFFIITPSPETLLPTIRSRVQTLEIPTDMSRRRLDLDMLDAGDFLAAPAQERLDMLKPLYEHDEDEGRDMAGVIAFLQALEEKFANAKRTPENDEGIRALYRARKYAGDKGSLLKSLLEQVALLAPKI